MSDDKIDVTGLVGDPAIDAKVEKHKDAIMEAAEKLTAAIQEAGYDLEPGDALRVNFYIGSNQETGEAAVAAVLIALSKRKPVDGIQLPLQGMGSPILGGV